MFAPWPTHYVLGNVDGNVSLLRSAIEEAGQTLHGRFGTIAAGGRSIALIHSDDVALFHEAIDSHDWDLVCYGHTHQAKCHLDAAHRRAEPRRRPLRLSAVGGPGRPRKPERYVNSSGVKLRNQAPRPRCPDYHWPI